MTMYNQLTVYITKYKITAFDAQAHLFGSAGAFSIEIAL